MDQKSVYVIRVTYGDDATWSASSEHLRTTDRVGLDHLLRRLRKQDNPYGLEFDLVEIKVIDQISDSDTHRAFTSLPGIQL